MSLTIQPAMVSVILPCFIMGRFIAGALASVAAQSYRLWEVIVVDDAGPEDGTSEIVAGFGQRFPENRVELIRHERNRGVSAARNTAIKNARGGLLAFLDPDDGWEGGYLQESVDRFDSTPDLSVTATAARIIEGDSASPTDRLEFFMPWEIAMFPWVMCVRNGFATSGVMLRRSSLPAGDLFDETPEIQHAEDWDLWLRLVECGVKFHLEPVPKVLYRKHAGAATARQAAMLQRVRAVIKKHAAMVSEGQAIVLGGMAWKIGQLENAALRGQPQPTGLLSRVRRRIRRLF